MPNEEDRNRVCPLERARHLDNRFRRLIHNPRRLLGKYVKPGMTVLDMGCGPGFFTVKLADLVGETGKVIAVDLQEGMLEKLKTKIRGKGIEPRVETLLCTKNDIGVTEKLDFVLAFYVAHEIPDLHGFFRQIKSLLKPSGQIFLAEPNARVTEKEFMETLKAAGKAGLKLAKKERVFFSRAVILSN